ncbi:DNA polymerase subunit gamma-2 [Synchiropus picturatus]
MSFRLSTWYVNNVLCQTRTLCSTSTTDLLGSVRSLQQLFVDRYYVSPGVRNVALLKMGLACNYGPLGTELRSNLLNQWWLSMSSSGAQIYGINTLCRHLVVDGENTFQEPDEISREELMKMNGILQESPSMRTNLLQGALEQFIPTFELMNKKLPFGLAETGTCFQSLDGSGCNSAEVTQASLVWFCSPRTSSQWLDHWARHRLKWWRKFALSPSDFSSSDVKEQDLEVAASRGIQISYNFPWGQEPIELLWSRGDTELLQMHKGNRSKLHCRDGRKTVPHVIAVSGNMDRGLLAFLSNSLLRREDAKQRLQQRKVLRLHPLLAPVKVALDINRGPTVELRRVCAGLQQEFLEAKISAWPGYLETAPTSMEQLTTKYDEMGVLFTILISENTLESGLLQVRSRDTTIRETMHISEVKNFISRYITAADNI